MAAVDSTRNVHDFRFPLSTPPKPTAATPVMVLITLVFKRHAPLTATTAIHADDPASRLRPFVLYRSLRFSCFSVQPTKKLFTASPAFTLFHCLFILSLSHFPVNGRAVDVLTNFFYTYRVLGSYGLPPSPVACLFFYAIQNNVDLCGRFFPKIRQICDQN